MSHAESLILRGNKIEREHLVGERSLGAPEVSRRPHGDGWVAQQGLDLDCVGCGIARATTPILGFSMLQ